jgi:hypothetical protein
MPGLLLLSDALLTSIHTLEFVERPRFLPR